MDSAPAENSKILVAIYKRSEADAAKQDKSVVPPMALSLCDKTFEVGNDWPKMPMGSAYIVHYLFARKHSGAWRFLPCDTFEHPPVGLHRGGRSTRYLTKKMMNETNMMSGRWDCERVQIWCCKLKQTICLVSSRSACKLWC
jgi:hypothetical protein